jgi:hypothetical protein
MAAAARLRYCCVALWLRGPPEARAAAGGPASLPAGGGGVGRWSSRFRPSSFSRSGFDAAGKSRAYWLVQSSRLWGWWGTGLARGGVPICLRSRAVAASPPPSPAPPPSSLPHPLSPPGAFHSRKRTKPHPPSDNLSRARALVAQTTQQHKAKGLRERGRERTRQRARAQRKTARRSTSPHQAA